MLRVPLRRVSAGLLALWFALTMVDAGWLHECAMHSPRPTVAAAAMPPAAHSPAAHSKAGHAHTATGTRAPEHTAYGAVAASAFDASATHDGSAPSHSGHQCVCIGACCVAQLAAVDFGAVGRDVVLIEAERRPVVATRGWIPTERAHRLPFATAPPTA